MQLSARWEVVGVVMEVTERTSTKNKEWRGYFVKMAAKGLVVDLDCTPEAFGQLHEGKIMGARGGFGQSREGGVKFRCDEVFTPPPEVAPVAPKAVRP